jgi:cholest-4-en-3-one 26-monooxygenase
MTDYRTSGQGKLVPAPAASDGTGRTGVPVELSDVDLIDQDQYVTAVPHEMFEVLRNEAPVFWHDEPEGVDARGLATGPGFWAVTKYDDIATVSRDWERYSSERGGVDMATPDAGELQNYRQMMLMMDPTKHTKLRLMVNKGFTPRMIGRLEAHVRDITADIVDKVIDRDECDFVGPVQRLRSNFINGIKHMPVQFTSVPAPATR